ncbi:MAG: glycosyltransferase family 9 protein [Bacteroidales bacterium]
MRLLVIRTSAMGDVALTTPVLRGMREQYPEVQLLFLTRPEFGPFFSSITGLDLFFPDLKKRHKGIYGLIRLFADIKRQSEINYVIDLHDVLRSKLLRLLFRISGVPVAVIDKGRQEKRLLISGKKKVQLKHSVERYCDVFAKAGFPLIPAKDKWIVPEPELISKTNILSGTRNGLNIGVAPYAKHKLKMWPEKNMVRLLELIAKNHKCRFWFFGGNEDSGKLFALQCRIAGSTSLVGKLSLSDELVFMNKLDLMITMDSSNMHMAALVGTKVISIWGGTDPLGGFGGWNQPDEFSIRIPVEELTCRPCTIFGKGECKRLDFACMNWLTPEMVYEKIEKLVLTGRR